MNRLRTTLGMQVGLRMGYGIVDESEETKIWFMTTGYLVAFSSNPANFSGVTHLIIDEVHERNLDGDLACFLTRELSKRNPQLLITQSNV